MSQLAKQLDNHQQTYIPLDKVLSGLVLTDARENHSGRAKQDDNEITRELAG